MKQNILNLKDSMKQWRCANVLDINDYKNETEYPFLVKELLISPPCLRPTCTTVNSKVSVSQNDITHRLGSLIRIDSTLRKAYELNPNNKEELASILNRLQLAFTLLFFFGTFLIFIGFSIFYFHVSTCFWDYLVSLIFVSF